MRWVNNFGKWLFTATNPEGPSPQRRIGDIETPTTAELRYAFYEARDRLAAQVLLEKLALRNDTPKKNK